MKFHCIPLLLCFCHLLAFIWCLEDPYKTLGVARSASIPEIKRAYKNLAREWHPDKNKDPDAEKKFIEINKAYELLMDPERRKDFDRFGKTEDSPNFRHHPDYSSFKRFDFDPFESLFNQGGFHFQFTFNQGSVYHRYTVTRRAYENNIIPDSHSRPYLILFYADLCIPCIHMEPVWQRIAQELEPLGMGFATIHSQHESALAKKIGVSSLPYLIGVIDGRPMHYRDEHLSLVKAVEFSQRMFPRKLIVPVEDGNVDDFLAGWSDNRVRVLVFSRAETMKLRYSLVAYYFNARAKFGKVHLGQENTKETQQKYGISSDVESLLVFNENPTSPIASLSMTELAPQMMKDLLEANKFLLLPRLSSQPLFDQICPPEAVFPRKRLCVILVTENSINFDPHRALLREFVDEQRLSKERVRFMYIYREKQTEFIKALATGEGSPENTLLHIVILWRRDQERVRYLWLDSEWSVEDEKANASVQELKSTLQRLMQTPDSLPYDTKVAQLADEHAYGLFTRILNRLLLMGDALRDSVTRYEVLPAVSIILSIGFIIVIGYVMSYLVKLEEKAIQEKYQKEGKTVPGVQPKSKPECKLNVHELRCETYNGLVRLLKPGCRTIVLLLDAESKHILLPKFFRTVYPYRRNKTLMFSFLMVEKNLEWYRRILLQALGDSRELNINPKNCIGTILSLNGHRKYFCVYHAKHLEAQQAASRRLKRAASKGGGEFIGFEDTTSDSEDSDVEAGKLLERKGKLDPDDYHSSVIFQEHLLDGLANWLDRLFEGTTKRYYINYWPESMK